jgi:tRNA threonylcarbamoyladenosine biosynthesis protein TsaB
MKKKVILQIDTTMSNRTEVSLEINGKKDNISQESAVWTSQVLLPIISKILEKNKIKLSDLSDIKVKTGPGSYTGIRVGVTVANALGFLFDLPVNGRKGIPVEPIY